MAYHAFRVRRYRHGPRATRGEEHAWQLDSSLAQVTEQDSNSSIYNHSRNEWEHHREAIVHLLERNTIEEVAHIMDIDHGFKAGICAYASKLREWRINPRPEAQSQHAQDRRNFDHRGLTKRVVSPYQCDVSDPAREELSHDGYDTEVGAGSSSFSTLKNETYHIPASESEILSQHLMSTSRNLYVELTDVSRTNISNSVRWLMTHGIFNNGWSGVVQPTLLPQQNLSLSVCYKMSPGVATAPQIFSILHRGQLAAGGHHLHAFPTLFCCEARPDGKWDPSDALADPCAEDMLCEWQIITQRQAFDMSLTYEYVPDEFQRHDILLWLHYDVPDGAFMMQSEGQLFTIMSCLCQQIQQFATYDRDGLLDTFLSPLALT